ncbi:MAG: tetratricopeptide repeat protein [Deltaproteobacteria bacterium]|nr:tetratricopeptide repeat protein [Deltaproteobacteria bacterium]MBW2019533.1 tetratricopeptide repeat protein [Deltaproteobacteria bacterium]MBW2074347.1 tetratricopeptide repeat protein [Deltaproteobacteria bacterium]RLB82779.1 MAG: hypothetical protein DRH17_04560 [Deltaproteobacteria bacterium]
MKRSSLVVIIVLLMLVFACTAGKPVKRIPRHLSAGDKQMTKGLEWYQKGCYRKSLEYFFRAYELFSASDVLDGAAMSLNNIGTIYRITGNYEEAVSFFDESYAIYSDLNDQEGIVRALSNKAATFIHMDKLDRAEQVIDEALDLLPKKNKRLLVPLLQNKGVLLTKKGLYQAAEKVFNSCLNQSHSLDPLGMASLHFAFGNLMLKAGRPEKAVASFEKALSIDRKLGFYKGIADDLFFMGLAYIRQGHDKEAVKVWKRSVKIYALIDLAREVHETMKHLTEAAQKTGVDISVTEAFVQRWRQGRLYESPCRD